MSGLVIAVIAVIAAYLLAGWRLAMKQLPQAWAKARGQWSIPEYVRSSVRWRTANVLFFWPVVLVIRSVTTRMDEVITSADPAELAAKVAEKDRYIAQLEREAGIRR